MLSGEKILITGPAGRIAFGLAKTYAGHNEVWGISRFSDPATRAEVDALGVTTRAIDIGDGGYGDLPPGIRSGRTIPSAMPDCPSRGRTPSARSPRRPSPGTAPGPSTCP